MKRLACSSLVVLAVASGARAHTLDEYVQALRVSVDGPQLTIHLDLTPGANIAAQIIQRADSDGDGRFSPLEAEAYGRAVIADLSVALDEAAVAPSLVRVEMPVADELRSGQGVIRVQATAPGTTATGPHRLHVRNEHMPALSVYLANALMPEAKSTRILRQTRDQRQQTYWLEYETGRSPVMTVAWLLSAMAGIAGLVWMRAGKASGASRASRASGAVS